MIEIMVFYTWGETALSKYDPGFQKEVTWDIPLLEGYAYTFVENRATDKGSHHFYGIVTPQLINMLEQWKPDAILLYGWNFKSHLSVMRHFYKKKQIFFRGDSTLLDEPKRFSIKKIVRRIFLKWVYKHIDVAFYTGQSNYDYFIAHGVKNEQLIYAPHAVDNDRFINPDKEYTSQANRLLNKIGINESHRVFLYAGKLKENKNVSLLIQAYTELAYLNAHLIIVGNGALENKLKQDFGDTHNLHFLDFQNQTQMPIIYRLADVFILPSKSGETWGLAANEAMASGCVVILSTNCGACRDVIVEGKNGFSFVAGNKEELKEKIKKIMELNNLNEMKLFAQEYIQKFSFDKICEAIEICMLS